MGIQDIFTRVHTFLNDRWALDYRSLALFRFGVGATLIADWIIRSSDMNAFYTDFGTLPRTDLINYFGTHFQFSFQMANGLLWFQYVLAAMGIVFALMMMLGYKTRWAVLISWILNLSIQARNPLVLHSGDNLLRLLMFFALFLPLGSAFSVDKAMDDGSKPRPGYKIWNGATMALVGQIIMMYVFAAYAKSGPEWTRDGSAVYYALSVDQLTTYLGYWLSQFRDILPIFSFGTLYLEMFGPYLFLAPVWVGPLRTLGVLLFVGLHIGFGTCMELGIFPWLDSFAVMAFLPTWFWDKLFGFLKTPGRTGLVIYYDGECGFCKKLVALLHTFFLLPQCQVRVAQETPEIAAQLVRENSWVVVDAQGVAHYRYGGFLAVAKASPLLGIIYGLLALGPVKSMGDALYKQVAEHRLDLAPLLSKIQFRPMNHGVSLLANCTATFFLVYCFFWNWDNTFKKPDEDFRLQPLGLTLQLDQGWGMFAPFPLKRDGWWVVEGRLMNRMPVEVLSGKEGPVSFEKPTIQAYIYSNERWRKYMMGLYMSENNTKQVENLAKYLCRNWNQDKMEENLDHQLDRFKVYFMSEWTAKPGEKQEPAQKQMMWEHYCFAPPAVDLNKPI